MNPFIARMTFLSTMAILTIAPQVFAGRGGGGYRGGNGGGGYGGYHGGGGYGGYGGGNHGGYGGSSSFNSPGYHSTGTGMSQGAKNEAAAGYAGGASANETAAARAGSGYPSGGAQNFNHPAGAAAVGAGYANNHTGGYGGYGGYGGAYGAYGGYGRYAGAWNGNYGIGGVGGVAAWGMGSPMYGYGYSGYSNPYNSMAMSGAALGGAGHVAAQPASGANYDYAQPINTAATAQPSASDQAGGLLSQAGDAFQTGDYKTALKLGQQAVALVPNDPTLHQFIALALFAQGNYDQAAVPLYAVLSVGPGWNWSTLIGHYADAALYTIQLRSLETYARANPESAQAAFVLAYHYITEGHSEAAAKQLKKVVRLQPSDTLSQQLLHKLEPSAPVAASTAAVVPVRSFDAAKLVGTWTAQAPAGTKITLEIKDGGGFTWSFAATGKPAVSVTGSSMVTDDVLTLNSPSTQAGVLKGRVAWQDDSHFTFKAIGGPAEDPGLQFAR